MSREAVSVRLDRSDKNGHSRIVDRAVVLSALLFRITES